MRVFVFVTYLSSVRECVTPYVIHVESSRRDLTNLTFSLQLFKSMQIAMIDSALHNVDHYI